MTNDKMHAGLFAGPEDRRYIKQSYVSLLGAREILELCGVDSAAHIGIAVCLADANDAVEYADNLRKTIASLNLALKNSMEWPC